MSEYGLTRRAVLAFTAGGAVMISLPTGASPPGLNNSDRQALLRIARLLYPHAPLSDTVYAEVLAPLHGSAASNAQLARALHNGIESLDAATSGKWSAASRGDQIAALHRIENGEFFGTVQNAVRSELYQHPAVWKLLGYPGSSLEFGGYIHRGFDEIDWLPED